MSNRQEKPLRLADAADQFGVTAETLRQWIAEGLLPAHRFGKRLVMVYPSDIDAMRTPITPTRGAS